MNDLLLLLGAIGLLDLLKLAERMDEFGQNAVVAEFSAYCNGLSSLFCSFS